MIMARNVYNLSVNIVHTYKYSHQGTIISAFGCHKPGYVTCEV